MKNISRKIILLLLTTFTSYYSYSQDLSIDDKTVIEEKIQSLVYDYLKYGTFTEKGDTLTNSYFGKFTSLFVSSSLPILNILPNNPKDSIYISVNRFTQNIRANYYQGLSLKDISTIELTSPIFVDNKIPYYLITASLNVKVVGFYRNTSFARNLLKLNFFFKVPADLSNLNSLKIEGIYDDEQIAKIYAKYSMKGIHLGIVFHQIL